MTTSNPSSLVTTVRASPSGVRVAMVTLLAAVACLTINAIIVWLAGAFDPSIAHFSHFRFFDYGTLTVLGVACAGAAWLVATRTVASPQRTFFRVAIVVTLVLWSPDLWLLVRHEPSRAVLTLVIMHAVIAVITYNLLVRVAPATAGNVRVASRTSPGRPMQPAVAGADAAGRTVPRGVWALMLSAVGVEFLAGLVGMAFVPFSRSDGWLSHRGEAIYLVHALLGGVLGLAALGIVARVLRRAKRNRLEFIGAVTGLSGVLIGAVGGVLCYSHGLRLLGMAVMFAGVSVAFFGFLIPMLDRGSHAPPAEAG